MLGFSGVGVTDDRVCVEEFEVSVTVKIPVKAKAVVGSLGDIRGDGI